MRFQIRVLVLASVLALASSCASRGLGLTPSHPPAADLTVEPEPTLPVAALGSEAAYEDWNQAVREWGRRGWDALARTCRWHAAHGAAITCPKPAAGSGLAGQH